MLATHAVARSLTDAEFTPAQADAITNAVRLATEARRRPMSRSNHQRLVSLCRPPARSWVVDLNGRLRERIDESVY